MQTFTVIAFGTYNVVLGPKTPYARAKVTLSGTNNSFAFNLNLFGDFAYFTDLNLLSNMKKQVYIPDTPKAALCVMLVLPLSLLNLENGATICLPKYEHFVNAKT